MTKFRPWLYLQKDCCIVLLTIFSHCCAVSFVFHRICYVQTYKKKRNTMAAKRIFQLIVVVAILVASFASTGGAMAWSGCASYITVQRGDTLSGLARLCGATVEAIRAANPGLGWWVYTGQVLYIPTGYTPAPVPVYYPTYGGTYVVQQGDTLGKIAASRGASLGDILAANPKIWNASLIYAGQVINLPAAAPVYYTVQYGDTLRIIANSYGTSVYSLQLLNPTIYNPNLIYPGQVVRVW
jgi:LysM repeat protein